MTMSLKTNTPGNSKLNVVPIVPAKEKQTEVADFIDFLLARFSSETQEGGFEQALHETAGIWPAEPDGLTYENQLRQQWQNRS